MNRGTIIYVGGFEMPDKNAAAHRVLNNGKALSELGYRVVYLGISHTETEFKKRVYAGMDCWVLPYPKGTKQWLRYLCDITPLKNVTAQYDDVKAVIFYNYQAEALLKGIRLCKKNGWASIADVTEWYLADRSNPIFYIVKKTDTWMRMRLLQPKMDGIISISGYLQNYYTKRGCLTVQVPPLIDKSDEKWPSRVSYTGEKCKIVYAGNSNDGKDLVSLAIAAARRLKDSVELHIIGNVSIGGKLKTPEDSEENIFYHGRLPHRDCVEIVASSAFQVCIRPDNLVTRAGFPTKLVESFACGTPVIANSHSNVGYYLEDGKNAITVAVTDEENVYEAFKRASELTREQIVEMKTRCKEDMRFDYREHIAVYCKLMQDVGGRGKNNA